MSAVLPNTQTSVVRKTYTGLAARILSLLSGGCTQVQAAHALGVSEAYVSQLMAEDDFKHQIAENIQKDFEKSIAIDNNYLEIEKQLSDKLKTQIGFMHNPDQLIKTLRFVNDAKRKSGIGAAVNGGTNGHSVPGGPVTVNLILPKVVVQDFVLNPNNEVVSVDGKELSTLNSESLNTLVAKRTSEKKALTYDAEQTRLPNILPKKKVTLTNEDLSNL